MHINFQPPDLELLVLLAEAIGELQNTPDFEIFKGLGKHWTFHWEHAHFSKRTMLKLNVKAV